MVSLGLGAVICFVAAVMFGVVGPDTSSDPSGVAAGPPGSGIVGRGAPGDHSGSGGGAGPDGDPGAAESLPPEAVDLDPDLLEDALASLRPSGAAAALVDPCLNGDVGACADLGEVLERECSDGVGSSCDLLYYATSAGSEQEAFGATCGGRFDDAAGQCAALLG